MALFSGKQKIKFCDRLGTNWQALADCLDIPEASQKTFSPGEESRAIWDWLKMRDKLKELYEALNYIGRNDLVVGIEEVAADDNQPDKPKRNIGNPFPGLRAFTEREASIFFGRNKEIDSVLDRLQETRFLAVIGASGSGKSSLVRAGVLPHLNRLSGNGQTDWLCFTPGGMSELNEDSDPDPFKALAIKLGPKLETENLTPLTISQQLYRKGNITNIVQKYLHANPDYTELIIVIDQFEELFTLVKAQYQQRFIAMLTKAAQCNKLRIIITIRADFYESCLDFPALAALINLGAWHLAPPDLASLWQMITQPARITGINYEPGLAEQILTDTGSGAGALALMAFALEQLHQHCGTDRLLSWDAYKDIGGIHQAIGQHAEMIYDRLDPEAQTALKTVFAELITMDSERGIATRRRASVAKICATAAGKRLFDAFTAARLLVTEDASGSADGAIAEVAHEALFSHWPLLQHWITERFDDFCLLRQVRLEATEWERNGRIEVNLWPHERLQQVYQMQQQLKPVLSETEMAFIRPEAKRLVEKLDNHELNHQQRERIGVRLAEIDDPRPGVGVDAKGLPDFDWLEVPPGLIELEDDAGKFEVQQFFISRYPVTYRQYRRFLKASDGYQNEQWWDNLKREKVPGEQYRIIDNHPADDVSWLDAMAYCRWLTDKLGYEIRLPTEWEWQQAATEGNPKYVYPWGEEFESHFCNTAESGLGRTTAVGLYPHGKSPVGALDMSGNVWEWCSNTYDQPDDADIDLETYRVVSGGSWFNCNGSRDGCCRDTPRARSPEGRSRTRRAQPVGHLLFSPFRGHVQL